jgi:hypothetical protein
MSSFRQFRRSFARAIGILARRVAGVISICCVGLMVATSVLWTHSYDALRWVSVELGVGYHLGNISMVNLSSFEFYWEDGQIQFQRHATWTTRDNVPKGYGALTFDYEKASVFFTNQLAHPVLGRIHGNRVWQWNRFCLENYIDPDSTPQWGSGGLYASAPMWFLITMLALFPLWHLTCAALRAWRYLRGRRRMRKGLCSQCGYELRASIGRCPECGAVANRGADNGTGGESKMFSLL